MDLVRCEEVTAPRPLSHHLTHVLLDGRVLVVSADGQTHIFDPSRSDWEDGGSLPAETSGPLTGLPDGRVLVRMWPRRRADKVGWTPAAMTWSPTDHHWRELSGPSGAEHRPGHAASSLHDGRVLFTGGFFREDYPSKDTHFFDPENDSWRKGPSLKTARADHHALVLSTGDVLLSGGVRNASFQKASRGEVLQSGASRWFTAGPIKSESNGVETDHGVIFYDGLLWSPTTRNARPIEGGFEYVGRLIRTSKGLVLGFGKDHVEAHSEDGWLRVGMLSHQVYEGTSITELLDGRILILGGTRVDGFRTGICGSLKADRVDLNVGALVTIGQPQNPSQKRRDSQAARILEAISPELEIDDRCSTDEVLSMIAAGLNAGPEPKAQARAIFDFLKSDHRFAYHGREWTIWRAIRT